MENENKEKNKFNMWKYVALILLLIAAMIIVLLLEISIAEASTINPEFEKAKIQFIYTGRLVPTVPGALDTIFIKNKDNLVKFQDNYFERYGYWNYLNRVRSRQLFGRWFL